MRTPSRSEPSKLCMCTQHHGQCLVKCPCVHAHIVLCSPQGMQAHRNLGAHLLSAPCPRRLPSSNSSATSLTEMCEVEAPWAAGLVLDEDGAVVEDEPQDLGEYSRPEARQPSGSRLPALPILRERKSRDGHEAMRAPYATGSSIVYAPTRAEVENIAAKLKVHSHNSRHRRACSCTPTYVRHVCACKFRMFRRLMCVCIYIVWVAD